MKDLWIKSKGLIAKIRLIDRFLILFMLIILLYTAIGLFTGAPDSQSGDMIDTIIRTSAASIFAYFISSNFKGSNTANPASGSDSSQNESPPSADSAEEPAKSPAAESPAAGASCGKLQVIIVSSIGGFALLLLFIAKFFIAEASEISATVSQLRDFVSACIGFLISCGRTK